MVVPGLENRYMLLPSLAAQDMLPASQAWLLNSEPQAKPPSLAQCFVAVLYFWPVRKWPAGNYRILGAGWLF
eukprot:COSAG01_NODE_625_length_14726_cov_9.023997_14_plen_72_part_00